MNTCGWAWVSRCARSSGIRNGGRVIVRADSAVFGGPSSIPRLDSIMAPMIGSMTMTPSSRWVLSRCRAAISPHRAPVHAAVTISSAAAGPPTGRRAVLSATARTSAGVAHMRSTRRSLRRRPRCRARIGLADDEAFIGGVGQQQRQQLHHTGHRHRRVALVAQLLGPGGGLDSGDVGQAVFPPAGQDVAAQQAAVEVLGSDRHIERGQPVRRPVRQGRLPRGRVDEAALALVDSRVFAWSVAAALVANPLIAPIVLSSRRYRSRQVWLPLCSTQAMADGPSFGRGMRVGLPGDERFVPSRGSGHAEVSVRRVSAWRCQRGPVDAVVRCGTGVVPGRRGWCLLGDGDQVGAGGPQVLAEEGGGHRAGGGAAAQPRSRTASKSAASPGV